MVLGLRCVWCCTPGLRFAIAGPACASAEVDRETDVGAVARRGLGDAAGHNKQNLSGRSRRAISLDRAARALPAELYHRVRQSALVSAADILYRVSAAERGRMLYVVHGPASTAGPANCRLLRLAVRLLYGLSWRSLSPTAAPKRSDRLLSFHRRRRRARRQFCRLNRAVDVQQLFRVSFRHAAGAGAASVRVESRRPALRLENRRGTNTFPGVCAGRTYYEAAQGRRRAKPQLLRRPAGARIQP